MTSDELKQVLSEDNGYEYVYLGSDINATSGFVINSNKVKIVIEKHLYIIYNTKKYILLGIFV